MSVRFNYSTALCIIASIMRTKKWPPKKNRSHASHAKKIEPILGRFRGHRKGFGFVIPDKPGEKDIFIGRRKTGEAMDGDRVSARIDFIKEGGLREGTIVQILDRAHHQVVGLFEQDNVVKERGGYCGRVVSSNTRIVQEVCIPTGKSLSAKNGDVVIATIKKYPSKRGGAEGVVLQILGKINDPKIDTLMVAASNALPPDFPPLAHKEADAVPRQVSGPMREKRVDLREMKTVTIDGEKARDFDDAISIEKTKDRFRLFVHITDVSHYIVPGSALDREAYQRATSVYFPDAVYPMFPPKLSNGILSLNPKTDRLTLTAEMEFDRNGNQIGYKLYESIIRSDERMTYTAVRAILEDKTPALLERYAPLLKSLETMQALAELLRKKRLARGSLDFDLPEPSIVLSLTGEIMDVIKEERNVAHRLIEEFMLAANETVAHHITHLKIPFLYRTHDPPDPQKIDALNDLIQSFSLTRPKTKTDKTPHKALSAVLEQVRGRPEEKLFNETLLRSMKQARYSEKNTGHFGLASEAYTHFTSPVRRYPDLIVHRLLKQTLHARKSGVMPLSEKEKARWAQLLPEMAVHTSDRERVADDAEREVIKRKKIRFMADKVGETFSGFISGVASFGFFVELSPFFVEGLVPLSTLPDDYVYDARYHRFVGRRRVFQLGDPVDVLVTQASLETLEVSFILISSLLPSPPRGRGLG